MNGRDPAHDDPLAAALDALRRTLDGAAFPGTALPAPRPRRKRWLVWAAGLAAAAAAAVLLVIARPEDGPAPAPASRAASATAGAGPTRSAAWTARWAPPSTARLAALRQRVSARAPIAVPPPPKPVTLTGDPWSTSWEVLCRRSSEETWAERIPRIRFRGVGVSPPKKRRTDDETHLPAGDGRGRPGHGRRPDGPGDRAAASA